MDLYRHKQNGRIIELLGDAEIGVNNYLVTYPINETNFSYYSIRVLEGEGHDTKEPINLLPKGELVDYEKLNKEQVQQLLPKYLIS